MHLSVKKQNPKFYFDILIHHKDIQVLITCNFSDSANLFTATGWQFLQSALPKL
jgi:hypothetical protein